MNEIGLLILLYAVAVLLLTAEIFIPSNGVLTVVGIAFLILAIVRTFHFGNTAGTIAIGATVVFLPAFAITAVKIWPHTRIGRKISPLNPVYSEGELGSKVGDIAPLVGKYGRTLSPLRPVGTCEFGERRLECVCESGMIDAGVMVRAVGVRGRNLEVAVADAQAAS